MHQLVELLLQLVVGQFFSGAEGLEFGLQGGLNVFFPLKGFQQDGIVFLLCAQQLLFFPINDFEQRFLLDLLVCLGRFVDFDGPPFFV